MLPIFNQARSHGGLGNTAPKFHFHTPKIKRERETDREKKIVLPNHKLKQIRCCVHNDCYICKVDGKICLLLNKKLQNWLSPQTPDK